MEILLKDIMPNPFRREKEYPYDPAKIERFVNSINENLFWQNIIARKSPNNNGKFEIAYGHHRIKALKKLKYKSIDIPIFDLDDNQMLKIMAEENHDDYKMSPAALNETIKAVRDYLNKQVKGETWEVFRTGTEHLFDTEHGFKIAQGKGVGEDTIKRFLGKNWSKSQIEQSIAMINAEEKDDFDIEVAEKMPTTKAARSFQKAAKTYKVPKKKQREIAKKLPKDVSSREVEKAIRKEKKTRRFLFNLIIRFL